MTLPSFSPTRRTFLTDTACVAALTTTLSAGLIGRAFASPVEEKLRLWADRINETCGDLRRSALSVTEWRTHLDDLSDDIPLADLLEGIDFERLVKSVGYTEKGVAARKLPLPGLDISKAHFYPKVFAVDQGRAIIPHGHANMVSAHLVLDGRFHVRQYDQVSRDAQSLLIRPVLDQVDGPGTISSIGLEDANVHWLIAEAPSHTLDVIVMGVDPYADQTYDIFNIDIDAAASEPDGTLRAPILSVEDALAKYG